MLKQSHNEEPPCAGNYSQDTDWPTIIPSNLDSGEKLKSITSLTLSYFYINNFK